MKKIKFLKNIKRRVVNGLVDISMTNMLLSQKKKGLGRSLTN